MTITREFLGNLQAAWGRENKSLRPDTSGPPGRTNASVPTQAHPYSSTNPSGAEAQFWFGGFTRR